MLERDHTEPTLDPNGLRPHLLDSVRVIKDESRRVVVCFCGQHIKRSIVPHMKKHHALEWTRWVETFVELRRHGMSLKKIMRLFHSKNGLLLFSWTVVDRAIRSFVEEGKVEYSPPPIRSVKTWEPLDFELETTTIWDFPIRGNWAVHLGDYRGNWPPQMVRNIILKYTSPDELVLDPFMGGGTTLIEAWLLGRRVWVSMLAN